MTAAGQWDYTAATQPSAYGDDTTYQLGMAWLDPCPMTEDWGCGTGYARQWCKGQYTGIDGSPSPFTTVVADLAAYRSRPDGIFMRHVLEHNHDWQPILANAVASFRQRMTLILFTPVAAQTTVIRAGRIPDLSLGRAGLDRILAGLHVTEEQVATVTEYGGEHLFYLSRQPSAWAGAR